MDLAELASLLQRPIRVWKDECAFSFDTPETADSGLYLNLFTYQAVSKRFVQLDHDRTGCMLYLNIKWHREYDAQKKQKVDEESKITKLAIGEDGGFGDSLAQGKLSKQYALCVMPDLDSKIEYPGTNSLPSELVEILDSVIALDDASHEIEVQTWNAEAEPRIISKFAKDLVQLENGIRISPDPKSWKCEDSGMTENLWLNLSTGYIGSGRRNWDGSGGTGAALKHFEETGSKYPLCVKLGTITPDGKADVYSYDPSEDCMVEDPNLGQHLKHFGINIMDLKKTERTMMEAEIELNQNAAIFSQVLEDNEKLEDCYGPGCVGLVNLGNSCYCNTVYQVLMSLQPFYNHYFGTFPEKRLNTFMSAPEQPQTDLFIQWVKLAAALRDPEAFHVQINEDGALAVTPSRLRDILGRDHPDFRGHEQQDAMEYLLFTLEKIQRNDHARDKSSPSPANLFSFVMEDKLTCLQSSKVRYSSSNHSCIRLKIPEFVPPTEGAPMPSFSFDECLALSLGHSEVVDGYVSPVTKQKGQALTRSLMSSFPKYLVLQVKRYIVDENWMPQKLDCKVDIPKKIDLEKFRGTGPASDEILLPEEDPKQQSAAETVDPMLLSQLLSMGFNENGCKRALIAVKNAGAEEAMNWVLEHMSDPDFDAPIEVASNATSDHDPEKVMMLESMGFSTKAANIALSKCDENLERAADWLFSHADDLDSFTEESKTGGNDVPVTDAEEKQHTGKYTLKGFISHLGKSTSAGHYVCHINVSENESTERWVLFNDRKVALSKRPPLDLGYVYIFERDD